MKVEIMVGKGGLTNEALGVHKGMLIIRNILLPS